MPDLLTTITVVVPILGALFFYFGKIVGDKTVKTYDSSDYSLEGLFFTIRNVIAPSVLLASAYVLNSKSLVLNATIVPITTLANTLAIYVFVAVLATRLKNEKDTFSEFRNPYLSFMLSFFCISLVFLAYTSSAFFPSPYGTPIPILGALGAFAALTVIANAEGRSKADYLWVKIHTIHGEDLEGTLIAVESHFYVLKDGKTTIGVNRENIVYIKKVQS